MVVPSGDGPIFTDTDIARLSNAVKQLSQQSNTYNRLPPGTAAQSSGISGVPGSFRSLGDPNDSRRGISVPQPAAVPGIPYMWAQAPSVGETGGGSSVPGVVGANEAALIETERSKQQQNPSIAEGPIPAPRQRPQKTVEKINPRYSEADGRSGRFGARVLQDGSEDPTGGLFVRPSSRDGNAGWDEQGLTKAIQDVAMYGDRARRFTAEDRTSAVEAIEKRTTGRSRTGTSPSTQRRVSRELRARAQRVTPEDVAYLQAVEDQLRIAGGGSLPPGLAARKNGETYDLAADIEVIPPETQAILDEYAERIPRDVSPPDDPMSPRGVRTRYERNQSAPKGIDGGTWTDSSRETVASTIQVPVRGVVNGQAQLLKITPDDLRRAGYSEENIAKSGRVGDYKTKTIATNTPSETNPVLHEESRLYNDSTVGAKNYKEETIGQVMDGIRARNRTQIRSQATIEQLKADEVFHPGTDPDRPSYRGFIDADQRAALGIPGSGPIRVFDTGRQSENGDETFRMDRDVPYDYDAIRDAVNPNPETFRQNPIDAPGDPTSGLGIESLGTQVVRVGGETFVDDDGVKRHVPGSGQSFEVGPAPFMNQPAAIADWQVEGKTEKDGSPKTKESYLTGIRRNNEASVGSKKVYRGRSGLVSNPMYERSKGITGSPNAVMSELAGVTGRQGPTESTFEARRDLAELVASGAVSIDQLSPNTARPNSVARQDLELAIRELDNEMARARGERSDGVERKPLRNAEDAVNAGIAVGEINPADLASGFGKGQGNEAEAPIEALFQAEKYGTTPGKALWAAGNIDGSGRTVASRYQVSPQAIADTSDIDYVESNYNNTDDFGISGIGEAIQADLRGFSSSSVRLSPEEEAGLSVAAGAFAQATGLDQMPDTRDTGVGPQIEEAAKRIYSDAVRTAHGIPTEAQIKASAAQYAGAVYGSGGRYGGSIDPYVSWETRHINKGAIADADAPVQQATNQGVTNTQAISQINAPAPQNSEFDGYNSRYARPLRR